MTAADKLRELLSSRPAMPNTEELVRWWRTSGALLYDLLAEVDAIDCDLVAERAAHRREQDARAELRVEFNALQRELERERIQHTADNEGAASALAQEAHEKSILEQVNAELKASLATLEVKCVRMLDANQAELRRLDVAVAEARAGLGGIASLCVECGPNVPVDEEGCCAACGNGATGAWLRGRGGK